MNAPDFKWSLNVCSGKQANSADISDDGKVLITGTSQEYAAGNAKDFALYLYDDAGKSRGTIPLGMESKGGIYWVALSGDGNHAAAGGDCICDGKQAGFVMGCDIKSKGASRFPLDGGKRVNQVAISHDGSYFVAVMGSVLYLFKLSNGAYAQSDQVDCGTMSAGNLTDGYLYTCDMSRDGQWIVVGCAYDKQAGLQKSKVGVVYLFQNKGGKLAQVFGGITESPILRAAITPDGEYFAASQEDGQVGLFRAGHSNGGASATRLWLHQPQDGTFAYAVAITKTSRAEVLVAFGYNHNGQDGTTANYGYASMLKNGTGNAGGDDACAVLWTTRLAYCPNPGMSLDTEGRFLTATDGEPIFDKSDEGSSARQRPTGNETPGNFYLIDARTGEVISNKPVSIMAWPMKITPDGKACIGADDDANMYYWR